MRNAKTDIYDKDQNDSCPYCNGGGNQRIFGKTDVPDNAIGKTVAPSTYRWNSDADDERTVFAVPEATNAESPVQEQTVQETVAPEQAPQEVTSQDVARQDEARQETADVEPVSLEPVVGWLVCIDGPSRGRDYRIFAKNNSIGRAKSNDICISGDDSIASENQARIGYDVKHNAFHFIPNEAANNIYIDDEPVYVPTKLSARQIIEIGDTKLIFVPLCDDTFSWEK